MKKQKLNLTVVLLFIISLPLIVFTAVLFYESGSHASTPTPLQKTTTIKSQINADFQLMKQEANRTTLVQVWGADDLEKRKKEFEIQAKERFEGDFWMPPQKNLQLPPALREFPKDAFGYPDWSAAVRLGIIEPIDSLSGQEPKKEEDFNEDIIFEINDRMMDNVVFSHRIHNYWFSCKVCHPAIFKPQKGANNFKMKDNWNGKYCGRCHGTVAYAPKGFENCIRCHSAGSAKG